MGKKGYNNATMPPLKQKHCDSGCVSVGFQYAAAISPAFGTSFHLDANVSLQVQLRNMICQ